MIVLRSRTVAVLVRGALEEAPAAAAIARWRLYEALLMSGGSRRDRALFARRKIVLKTRTINVHATDPMARHARATILAPFRNG